MKTLCLFVMVTITGVVCVKAQDTVAKSIPNGSVNESRARAFADCLRSGKTQQQCESDESLTTVSHGVDTVAALTAKIAELQKIVALYQANHEKLAVVANACLQPLYDTERQIAELMKPKDAK